MLIAKIIILVFGFISILNSGDSFHSLEGIQTNNQTKYYTAFADNFLQPSLNIYESYFASFTQQAVNLTKDYQDKVGLWQLGQLSNDSMAEITSEYLGKFTYQLDQFNQTKAPKAFEEAKTNLTRSFSNEIKSYESFRDYLLTGNITKNEISTDYLSQSLEDEANSFKSFQEAQDNENENGVPISYYSLDPNLNVTSISGFWSGSYYTIVGEIQNTGQDNLQSPEIIASLYDITDRLVGTSNTIANPSNIAPIGQAFFKLSIGPDDVADFGKVKEIRLMLN